MKKTNTKQIPAAAHDARRHQWGAWLFAAEVNFGNSENGAFDVDTISSNDVDVLSGLLMANYAYSDDSSVTARLSYEEVDDGTIDTDLTKYTLAHNKALADNLALIVELSYAEAEVSNVVGDIEATQLAVELLFTF